MLRFKGEVGANFSLGHLLKLKCAHLEFTHFIFNKCPIYTTGGASAKFSINYETHSKDKYRKCETNIPRKVVLLCGYSPNSYIQVSVSDLYIPLIGLPTVFCSRKIAGPNVGLYRSLKYT